MMNMEDARPVNGPADDYDDGQTPSSSTAYNQGQGTSTKYKCTVTRLLNITHLSQQGTSLTHRTPLGLNILQLVLNPLEGKITYY